MIILCSLPKMVWQAFWWNVPLSEFADGSPIQKRWTVWSGTRIIEPQYPNTPAGRLVCLAEHNSRSLSRRLSVAWSRTCGRGLKISVRLLALYAHARPRAPWFPAQVNGITDSARSLGLARHLTSSKTRDAGAWSLNVLF
jgi:hypothetical protein